MSTLPPTVEKDLTDQAMGLVFYDQFTPERAFAWLTWREGIADPAHSLNKNPLMTLMVLDKWLRSDPLHAGLPQATPWTRQVLNASATWKWPTNSSSTELYYRLGEMLSAPSRLDFIETLAFDDPSLTALLAWCEQLEDHVRPKLSAAIGYQLQDNGVVLCAPQEAVLDAIGARVLAQESAVPAMDILWRSPRAKNDGDYVSALVRCAPYSLPAAMTRCLLRGDAWEKSPTDFAATTPIFGMDPAQSEPTQLLDALMLVHHTATAREIAPYTQAVWDRCAKAWPAYTGLLQTFTALGGEEALLPKSPMRPQILEHLTFLQKGQMPPIFPVGGMFDFQAA